ncbi:hypothetical protein MMPV_001784 [Pyropia vietnamensis]
MKPSSRVILPPRPTACVAIAVAAAVAWAGTRSILEARAPLGLAACFVAAALAAVLAVLLWPRVATDLLHLHGTSFPTPKDESGSLFTGILWPMVRAEASEELPQHYLAAAAAVGWGVNHQVYLFGARHVRLVHPADARALLVKANPPRSLLTARHFNRFIHPEQFFFLADPAHDRLRRLVSTYLTSSRMQEAVATCVSGALDSTRGGWGSVLDAAAASGASVDIDDTMMDLTLDVIHNLLFSAPYHGEERAAARKAVGSFFGDVRYAFVPWPEVFAKQYVARVQSASQLFMAHLESMAAKRRCEDAASEAAGGAAVRGNQPRDLLDVWLADLKARDGAYGGDLRRMAADALAYTAAGFDTTAHTISWTIHELLDQPIACMRLRDELVKAAPPGAPPTPLKLADLPFAAAVFKEIQRLHPAAPMTARRVLEAPLTLPSDGSVIPAGTTVEVPIIALHLNPDVFPEPTIFRPERWLSFGAGQPMAGVPVSPAGRASYMPFALGGRGCLGQQTAATEWASVLVALLGRYSFERVGDRRHVTPKTSTTMRPAGLRVRLRRL